MKNKLGCLYDIIGGIVFIFIISLFIAPIRNWEWNSLKSFVHQEVQKDSTNTDTVKTDTIFQRIEVGKKTLVGDTIQLLRSANSKTVNVEASLSGIPMKFCLDTGCSDIALSSLEYHFLKKHGYIQPNSEKEGTCTLADGTKHPIVSYQLDYLALGKDTVYNVECSTIMDDSLSMSEILLGQSTLDKFGDIIISYKNNQLIIIKN